MKRSGRFINSPRRMIHRLRAIQNAICPLCGRGLPPLDNMCAPAKICTIEHVWPLHPSKGAVPKGRKFGDYQNIFVTHADCNRLKGNRWPRGCELIWLDAVNSRLNLRPKTFVGDDFSA